MELLEISPEEIAKKLPESLFAESGHLPKLCSPGNSIRPDPLSTNPEPQPPRNFKSVAALAKFAGGQKDWEMVAIFDAVPTLSKGKLEVQTYCNQIIVKHKGNRFMTPQEAS